MHHPFPGKTGLVVQSGAVGAALVEQFARLGIGTSSFASVGDMLDVSGTDMLLWWEADNTTELAVLYLESFGNPRRFARTARRVSAKILILTVHAGRSAPGQRAAATGAPLITREALFDQAGIIATASFGELLDASVLVASQPVPAGSVVSIVSNGGGAGVLAADACAEAGLTVATTGPKIRSRLREVLPADSALGGPVDTTSAVTAEAFREALHIAAAEDGVDALIAVVVRHAPVDLIPVLTAGRLPVPVAAVVLDQPEAVRLLHGGGTAPGRACLRLPRSGRPRAGPGRPLRLAAIPAGRHGTGARGPAGGGRPHNRRFVPRADARRRLAIRRRGRRPAALVGGAWIVGVQRRGGQHGQLAAARLAPGGRAARPTPTAGCCGRRCSAASGRSGWPPPAPSRR